VRGSQPSLPWRDFARFGVGFLVADEHASSLDGHAGAEHHGSVWPFVIALAGGVGFARVITYFPLAFVGLGLLAFGVGGCLWHDARGVRFGDVTHSTQPGTLRDVSLRTLGLWLVIVPDSCSFSAIRR